MHPHATSEPAERAEWDSSMRVVDEGFRQLERFFLDVIEGRITSPDSVARAGFQFFGVQGPWYTVGWKMASTVERERGRTGLIEVMCRPKDLMAAYNEVAGSGPCWNEELIGRLPL